MSYCSDISVLCTVKSRLWEYYINGVKFIKSLYVKELVITSHSSVFCLWMSSNSFCSALILSRPSSSLQFMYNVVYVHCFRLYIKIIWYVGVNNWSLHVKTCLLCPEAGLSSFAALLLLKRDSEKGSSPAGQPLAHVSHLTQTAYIGS